MIQNATRLVIGVLTATMVLAGGARAQAPSTDIFMVPVDGTEVGPARRITDRDGYDNQPQFLPDGELLAYTSLRGDSTDIIVHDIAAGTAEQLTRTAESEYSPTPRPGKQALSVVRDYGDLKQQLWSFPLDGGEPTLLLPDISPVGYHAWVDDETVLLFVLGRDEAPHTLQVTGIGPGRGRVLGESPGRALARIPGSDEMSYIDKSDAETWWLTALDVTTGKTRRLVATLPQREDMAWAPDGRAWMGDGSHLHRWSPGDESWSLVADLEKEGIAGITRLAFSPDGRLMALVAERPTD